MVGYWRFRIGKQPATAPLASPSKPRYEFTKTYKGKVANGAVVLPPEADLPDGTEVEVTPVRESPAAKSFHGRYARFAGMARDLPADLAENHDHYLHGHPKK